MTTPVYHLVPSEDPVDGLPSAKDKAKKWETIIPIVFTILMLAVLILAVVLHFQGKGETALHNCRMFATFCAFCLILSMGRMFCIWYFLKPIDAEKAKNYIPVTMGFFIFFMTLGAFFGYFEKITKLRIFWEFDFVLHYDIKFKTDDLIMDCIYAVVVLFYLLVQCFYFMFVAPVTHISTFDKWPFTFTLFINALQKWDYESIEVHMEMCEEYNQASKELNHTRRICKTYMNYTTSDENLSHRKHELYTSTNYLDPLTYTITMELFFACIALLFHFSHNHNEEIHRGDAIPEQNPRNNDLNEEDRRNDVDSEGNQPIPALHQETHWNIDLNIQIPNKWIRCGIWFCCLCIAVLLLALIHMGPVIFVWPDHFSHRLERVAFRLAACGLILIIAFCSYKWIFVFAVPRRATEHDNKLRRFAQYFKAMDPDIKILWFACSINIILFALKLFIELLFLWNTFDEREEKILYFLSQLGNILEIISSVVLIVLVEKLLHYADNIPPNPKRTFVAKFVFSYGLLSLLSFMACYKLKSLHYSLDDIISENAVNFLILIQSTYPSTLLFNMTLCLCFATIGEKLFKKGFFKFEEKTANAEANDGTHSNQNTLQNTEPSTSQSSVNAQLHQETINLIV